MWRTTKLKLKSRIHIPVEIVKQIMIPCIYKHKNTKEMKNMKESNKESENLTISIRKNIWNFTYITATIKKAGVEYKAEFMYDSFSRDENYKHNGELYSL